MVRDWCTLAQEFLVLYTCVCVCVCVCRFGSLTAALSSLTALLFLPLLRIIVSQITLVLAGPHCASAHKIFFGVCRVFQKCV